MCIKGFISAVAIMLLNIKADWNRAFCAAFLMGKE